MVEAISNNGVIFARLEVPFVTIISVTLATAMFLASHWQWSRYKAKIELVRTYASNRSAVPLSLPSLPAGSEQFEPLLDRRIRVRGIFDYSRQILVTNRQGPSGPGHHLVTPLRLSGSQWSILVSRGFIPFNQRAPEDWRQYDFSPQQEEELEAVVKKSVPKGIFAPPNPPNSDTTGVFQRIWLYPDIEQLAKQFPYPVVPNVFLQRLGPPPMGTFPAEAVSVEVPPQVHFGYTIEWIMLGLVTLAIGFAIQVFPRRGKE